jgi:hypothetical protein
MIPNNTESAFTLEFLRPDGLSLETPFGWGVLVDGQEQRGALLRMITMDKKVGRALRTLPLGDADVAAAGHRVDYIQDIATRLLPVRDLRALAHAGLEAQLKGHLDRSLSGRRNCGGSVPPGACRARPPAWIAHRTVRSACRALRIRSRDDRCVQ